MQNVEFIDRTEEIRAIEGAITQMLGGAGNAVIICGEPGVGKTRLLEETKKIAQDRALVLSIRCVPEKRNPYGFIVELVNQGITKTRNAVQEGYTPLGLASGEIRASKDFAAIDARRILVLENIYRKIQEIAHDRALMLTIDDLQWADSGTISAIHYIARNIEKQRILLLCAYTPGENEFLEETVKRMNIERIVHILKLKPFSFEDARTMASMVAGSKLPDKVLRKIHEITSGNPLFILEIAEQIRGMGPGTILKKISVPEPIRNAYRKKIERMEKEEQKILSSLAVMGREFSFAEACTILDYAEEDLAEVIDKLISSGFIRESAEAAERYSFVNNPVYEVAYAILSQQELKSLHKKIAHYLMKEQKPERFAEIAQHLASAECPECVEYFEKTAEYFLANLAIDDAMLSARHAEEYAEKFACSQGLKFEIYRTLGALYTTVADFEKGLEYYRRALALDTGDAIKKAEIALRMGIIYVKKGMYADALKELQSIPQEVANHPEIRAQYLFENGTVLSRMGDLAAADEKFQKALETLAHAPDPKLEGEIYNALGVLYQSLGNNTKAEEYLLHAHRIIKENNFRLALGGSCNALGLFYTNQGKIDLGLQYLLEGEKIYNDAGDIYGLSIVINNIGIVYWSRGDYGKAIEYFQKELENTAKIGDKSGMGYALYNIGTIYDENRNYEKARQYYEKANQIFREIGEKYMTLFSEAQIGWAMAACGKTREGLEIVNSVLSQLEGDANVDDIAGITFLKAKILTISGEYDLAEGYFLDVIETFTQLKKINDLATALHELGRMYMQSGKKEKAHETLSEALKVATELGATALVESIRKTLNQI